MDPQLKSINAYAQARKAPARSAPGIEGTCCDGCRELECIATRKRTEPWRFYCELQRAHVQPRALEACPVGQRDLPRREAFGEWMTRRLREEGMTQRELSDRAGVDRRNVSKYASKTVLPNAPTRKRIQRVLGKWPGETLL